MDLAEINIYRITHIDNIPHILQYGITHRNSSSRNPNFVSIGDRSLIHTRDHRLVSVDNGDFLNTQAPTIILGHFIPFYFGVKMPMLFVVQNGGNFVPAPTHPSDIVYLVCSVCQIIDRHETYYFSDGHATDNLTTFYGHKKINDLPQIIDWAAVRASYWGGQENLNLRRKKQAEFLIANDISSELIIGFACYNNKAKDKLVGYGIKEEKIRVSPNAYY